MGGCPMSPAEMGVPSGSAFRLNGTSAVYTDGFVGVGTDTPTEQLELMGNAKVNGTVYANAFSSQSPLQLQTAGQTRVFVDDVTGNVGVGTSTPLAPFHILHPMTASMRMTATSPSGSVLILENLDPAPIQLGDVRFFDGTSTRGSIQYLATDVMKFNTLNTERIRIDQNGNVGIGETLPDSKLKIDTPFGTHPLQVQLNNITRLWVHSNGRVAIGAPVTPTEALHVTGNLRVDGNICATGSIGMCSDARFKENVAPLANALERVEQLRPVTFDWRREEFPDHSFSETRQSGLIAQEVRGLFPDLVAEGSDGYLSVDYARLTPILVQALREHRAEAAAEGARRDGEIEKLRDANEHLVLLVRRLEKRFENLEAQPTAVRVAASQP